MLSTALQLVKDVPDIDPTTGFISYDRSDAFSVTKKVEFLRLYRQNLNMTKSAELVGSLRQTVMWHMERDKNFAKAVTQAKIGVADRLVEVAVDNACKPEGVRDRWTLIERCNPDEFGKLDALSPTVNIVLDGKMLEHSKAQTQAIDAEVLASYESTTGTLPPTTQPQ